MLSHSDLVNERFTVEDCAASIRATTQKSRTIHPADRYGQEIRINVDHRKLVIMKPMLLNMYNRYAVALFDFR